MSSVWNISVSDSVSPPPSASSSNDRYHSPIFGLMDNSSTNSNSSSNADNADLATTRTANEMMPRTMDLTNDGWQIGNHESLHNDDIEAEIASIRLFCENVENNLAEVGLRPGGASSTPRIVDARRSVPVNNTDQSVDLIDLSNVEFNFPRSARGRAPDTIIDLCTPEPRRHLPTFINLADSFEEPSRINRRLPLNSSDNQGTLVEHTSGFCPSSPKRERVEINDSCDGTYKCPVCLDSVRRREPSSTKCGHVFCKSCIEAAVQSTRKCPLCNKRMTRRSIFRIYL